MQVLYSHQPILFYYIPETLPKKKTSANYDWLRNQMKNIYQEKTASLNFLNKSFGPDLNSIYKRSGQNNKQKLNFKLNFNNRN